MIVVGFSMVHLMAMTLAGQMTCILEVKQEILDHLSGTFWIQYIFPDISKNIEELLKFKIVT